MQELLHVRHSIHLSVGKADERCDSAQNLKKGKTSDLTYGQLYLAGAGAGITNSVVSGPVEHIRIRLQTQTKGSGQVWYNGPWDACKKIYATDGIRGIFHGQGATLLRCACTYCKWSKADKMAIAEKSRRTECTSWHMRRLSRIS